MNVESTRGLAPRVSLAAAAMCSLALAACGSTASNAGSDAGGAASTTAAKPAGGTTPWCGTKPITLGIQDGGGLNGWSKSSLQQIQLEAKKCPAIKKTIVVNAGFDLQKAISGTNSLVAQGANAIVIIPDAGGPAELAGIRTATAHGVKVVPWGSNPGGTPGKDYVTYVDWDPTAAGRTWATWLAKSMKEQGNVIYLGGPAGNAVDKGERAGVIETFKQYPKIKLVTGTNPDSWPVTNWDPAQSQKVMSGLLTRYPKIDGILMGDGQSSAAVVKVLKAAGRPIPPVATLEANQVACSWKAEDGTSDSFELATISGRNWMGRLAVRKAVAAVNGIANDEKSIISLPLFEDSVAGGDLAPHCDSTRPPDAYMSNDLLSQETLNGLTGAAAGAE
ncbi:MAG TPA: substrate-binding domain-containing protein [Baekduia sp.]|uniref:substrate-binding domain-containing protein n=1 Tax=Baekduia sp. TaxID=2600305 RepID=UPI002CBF690A|nr:substrate-binding domain-containing protein [Baekduia sp.]HMJ34253.1 substrate-binding domain-containing protein [Baekduia sp.]